MDITIDPESVRNGLIASFNLEICPGAFEVVLILQAFANENFIVSVDIEMLMRLSGFSVKKVVGILAKLKEKGIIVFVGRKQHGPNIYKIEEFL